MSELEASLCHNVIFSFPKQSKPPFSQIPFTQSTTRTACSFESFNFERIKVEICLWALSLLLLLPCFACTVCYVHIFFFWQLQSLQLSSAMESFQNMMQELNNSQNIYIYIRALCLRLNLHPKSSTIDPLVDFLLGQQHEFSSSLLVSHKGQHHLRYRWGRSCIAQQSRAIHSPAEWPNKLLINDCALQHSENCLDREEDESRQWELDIC